MGKNRNNKRNIIHNWVLLSSCSVLYALRAKLSGKRYKLLALSSQLSAFCFTLLAICFIFSWLLFPDKANSGPYLDSAHGDTSYGVNRTSIAAFGYSKGNCAHCHEQHASIGGTEPAPVDGDPSKYALFRPLFSDQATGFCYSCHKDIATSVQVSIPNQYIYSRTAGGETIACPDDIKEAFQFVNNSGVPQSNCGSSQGSSHLLKNIETFLTGKWGYDKFSICSGCHNPHRAQRDPHTVTGRMADGKWLSAVSLPSEHADLMTWDLYGNDTTERMDKYNYQSPYRYNSTSTYEPDGYSSNDASRTFDSVTFCLDCHKESVSSTYRGSLRAINWNGGDVHGVGNQSICDWGDKKEPYYKNGAGESIDYVLSCLDCHEPHGSRNGFLLRREVNGKPVPALTTGRLADGSIDGLNYLWDFCTACHTINTHAGPGLSCTTSDCHHRHGGTDSITCSTTTKKML